MLQAPPSRPRLCSSCSTILTGVVYPLVVTGVAQVALSRAGQRQPHRARTARSLGSDADRPAVLGSEALLGHGPRRPRPIRTTPLPRAASNQGPTQPRARPTRSPARVKALREADPGNHRAGARRPRDGLGAAGSIPHISPAAAEYQVARVAKARGLDAAKVRELVAQHTEGRQLGFLGEPRVNVLELNLALDKLH